MSSVSVPAASYIRISHTTSFDQSSTAIAGAAPRTALVGDGQGEDVGDNSGADSRKPENGAGFEDPVPFFCSESAANALLGRPGRPGGKIRGLRGTGFRPASGLGPGSERPMVGTLDEAAALVLAATHET